jgi:Condensation domain/Phosphopantetheine attachment site
MLELKSAPAIVLKNPEIAESSSTDIPLSFGQQRLWVHQQSAPESPLYNLPIAYHLKGTIDPIILQQSLQEIIQRHDSLRTTFVQVDEKPIQRVSPDVKVELPIVDLSHLSPDRQESESTRIAIADAQQPFDLTQPPLWRFQLLRLGENQHILLLTIHHILTDRWSLDLLMGELARLYDAFIFGQPSLLPPPNKQYADFTLWQNQWLLGKRWESQLNYWKQQLGGNPPPVELPVKPGKRFASSYAGERTPFALNPELTAALKGISDRESVTPFMTLLAAWDWLLYQYNQQEDTIVCTPVAGRHRAETKGVLGYFNNIVPVRVDLSGNPSFPETIARVRQAALGAYKNMDVPFQAIADLPELARTPLARVMLALQPGANDTISLPHLEICYPKFQNVHNGTANFDLSLFLEEKDGNWTGAIDYKTDLFEAATITDIIDQFQNLLEKIVANSELRLSDLPSFKIDRSSAPEPTAYVAPSKDLERTIVGVWQEMLQLETVGIHNNFFDLGAHSLMMVKTCDRLSVVLNRTVAIVDLFRYPTIHALAQYLSQEAGTEKFTFGQIQDSAQRRKAAFQKQKQLRQQRSKING